MENIIYLVIGPAIWFLFGLWISSQRRTHNHAIDLQWKYENNPTSNRAKLAWRDVNQWFANKYGTSKKLASMFALFPIGGVPAIIVVLFFIWLFFLFKQFKWPDWIASGIAIVIPAFSVIGFLAMGFLVIMHEEHIMTNGKWDLRVLNNKGAMETARTNESYNHCMSIASVWMGEGAVRKAWCYSTVDETYFTYPTDILTRDECKYGCTWKFPNDWGWGHSNEGDEK